MSTTQLRELRKALDAHKQQPGTLSHIERCSCGDWSEMSSDYRTWADHREAAVRAALDAEPTALTQEQVENAYAQAVTLGRHGDGFFADLTDRLNTVAALAARPALTDEQQAIRHERHVAARTLMPDCPNCDALNESAAEARYERE